MHFSIGAAQQKKTAAAEIACRGMSNSECEANRNSGIDGIPTASEHLKAYIGRQRLLRNYHPVPGSNQAFARRSGAEQEKEERTNPCFCGAQRHTEPV
jgi:hypothetical protein